MEYMLVRISQMVGTQNIRPPNKKANEKPQGLVSSRIY